MNYRHHYHAGNFADLVKHAILLELIRQIKLSGRPMTLVDTHAGAGLYDLAADPARKSGEADLGIRRLFEQARGHAVAGDVLSPLLASVQAFNPTELRVYPGSPALAIHALAQGDRVIACELRPDEATELRTNLDQIRPSAGGPDVIVRTVDGYDYAAGLKCEASRELLILIDPPYELGNDYDRVVDTAARLLSLSPRPTVAIWVPLKDLETLDHLLRRLETLPEINGFVAQTRLQPLVNPMRMNGCAMIVLGKIDSLAFASAASERVAVLCGGDGACSRTTYLGA